MLDLSGLNQAQLEAVLTTEGPVLVLAGAGSGKTRVITYRLAHLITRSVDPKSILCVTFTNKAASEMQDRAKKLAGRAVRGTTIATFHALGSKILRTYGERVGLRSSFAICDGAEQIGSVRRILRDLRIDDRHFDPKRIQAHLSRLKNLGIDAETYRAQDGVVEGADNDLPEDYAIASIEAYERYESSLRVQNLVDFDDLLLLTLRLLKNDEEVRSRLERKWRYLMIDEYQDTNGAQLEIMRLLAGKTRNLCVVGDDDQSIYGWRGADVRNILRFEEHYPGAKRVTLDINYRSTGHILAVANAIISKNPQRFEKTLKAAADEGSRVRVAALPDEEAEAEEISRQILALIARGESPSEIAVLFRSNVQSRSIELALRRAHVAYRVVGGMELFDRKEVKDALCYLRFLDNPEDEQSLRRIINFPPRGIGDTTVERVDGWARQRGLPLLEGLDRVQEIDGITAKAQDAITVFLKMFQDHRKMLSRCKASTVAKRLFAAANLEETLFGSSDNAIAAERRVDNVREIVRQIERYEDVKKAVTKRELFEIQADRQDAEPLDGSDINDGQEVDSAPDLERVHENTKESARDDVDIDAKEHELGLLSTFLSELSMGAWSDQHDSKVERKDQVVLSTIHAAKGLEWFHVFIVGCEEELLPHKRTVGEGGGGIDEERRLAYVAVTRARRQLTMTYARTRTRWGRIERRIKSRFIEELPEGTVELVEGEVKEERTEAEKDAVAKQWMAKIRAQLGIDGEAGSKSTVETKR